MQSPVRFVFVPHRNMWWNRQNKIASWPCIRVSYRRQPVNDRTYYYNSIPWIWQVCASLDISFLICKLLRPTLKNSCVYQGDVWRLPSTRIPERKWDKRLSHFYFSRPLAALLTLLTQAQPQRGKGGRVERWSLEPSSESDISVGLFLFSKLQNCHPFEPICLLI